MTAPVAGTARLGILRPLLPAAAVVGVTLFLVASSPGGTSPATAGTASWARPTTYSNHLLTATMGPGSPGLVVASVAQHDPYGLNVSLAGLTEYRGTGLPIARADLAATTWAVTNSSSSAGLAWSYSAPVREVRTGSGAVVGTFELYVNLTAFARTTGVAATSIQVSLLVMNWTWSKASDSLALAWSIAPNDSAIEHLGSGPTNTMDCYPNDGSPATEYLTWDGAASATSSVRSGLVVPTIAQVTGSPQLSTVSVAFAGSNTTYTQLAYGMRIGILLAPTPPAVALWLGLTAGTAAAALAPVGVVLARRANERPSSLREVPG